MHRRTRYRFRDLARRYGELLLQGMQKTVEETALNSPSEIDTRAFQWTFDCLDEDHELEHFFSGIPGFRNSKEVKDPFFTLSEDGKQRLFTAMTGLLDRTFSSALLPEADKKRRAIICTKAVDPAHTPEAFIVLNTVLSKHQISDPLVAEIAQVVRGWKIDNKNAMSDAKATFSMNVARVQSRDDSWFILASKSLGVPETDLRHHAAHGDSLSLAILINVTRQKFSHFWWFLSRPEFFEILKEISKFNVQDTSPELRHEFCVLWNQIVSKAQDGRNWRMAPFILRRIRNVYVDLHEGTDSAPTQFSPFTGDSDDVLRYPFSYPVCNIPGHHLYSTPHIRDDSIPATYAHAIPHDHYNTANVGSPEIPSSYPHALHPVDQTTTESRRILATSPDPVTTRGTHGSADTSTPEPSTSTPPLKSTASTSPIDAFAVQHTPIGRSPSLDVLPSPSAQAHFTGPPLTSDSAVTRFTHVSSPESYTSPGASGPFRPSLIPAPDPGVAAEGGGSVKPTLRKEQTAPHPASTTRDDIMANPDLPPQPQ